MSWSISNKILNISAEIILVGKVEHVIDISLAKRESLDSFVELVNHSLSIDAFLQNFVNQEVLTVVIEIDISWKTTPFRIYLPLQ